MMQPERFCISLKNVPYSSKHFTNTLMSFDSFNEALTEKTRLKLFENIESSAIRCMVKSEEKDFDMVARSAFPQKYDSWLQACDDREVAIEEERLKREHQHERYLQDLRARQEKAAYLDQRRQLDKKVLAGELTKAEYLAAVQEWDAGRE